MRTRLIGAALAVVLAAVGTVVLLMYVRSASTHSAASASAPQATVDVLVASGSISVGASAAGMKELVATTAVPTDAALQNRVTDLSQLAGKVALVPIEPGEQLLAGKFGTALAETSTGAAVSVPPNLQQVTVLVRADQALGGKLKTGDTVGVFVTLKSGATHLVAQKVLVTAVEESTAPPMATQVPPTTTPPPTSTDTTVATSVSTTSTAPTVPTDPTLEVLVTLATTAGNAEKVVWAAENASIWFSKEPLTADETGTGIIDETKVLK